MPALKLLAGWLLALVVAANVQAECARQSLRFAVIPKKNMGVLIGEYQPLLQRLSTALGMPVEIVAASSYESVIDAIVSGGVDIAWLGPASYILAHQRDPRIEPFAILTIDRGYFTPAGHSYQALLLVRRDGASDLGALRGTRAALSDPASTSGSVVPSAEFPLQVHLPLSQYFSSLVYTGSHDKSLDALLERRVDAAFVSSVQADTYLNSRHLSGDTFTVLWRSGPLYHDPFVFSGSLCTALKERVRAAMLSEPQALAAFLASQHASGIAPVGHAQYGPLLQMMQGEPARR